MVAVQARMDGEGQSFAFRPSVELDKPFMGANADGK